MKRLHRIALVLSFLFISACASVGVIDKDATLDGNEESIFVIGVAPANYLLVVYPVNAELGTFAMKQTALPARRGVPTDGYLVGKASAGETLAITGVQVMESNTDVMGKQRYWMCGGAESLTFKAPGGKVIYVGDVRYSQVGTSLGAKYKQDFEAAKKYVDSNFPGLRNRLEPWTYKVMPSSDSCTQTIYVPATR